MKIDRCICGRVCTTKAGFALHQKSCEKVKEAREKGESTSLDVDVVEQIDFVEPVKQLVDAVNELAEDAHKAITENNKSAGRRSRIALLKLKQMILPLRKQILDHIKGGKYLKAHGGEEATEKDNNG